MPPSARQNAPAPSNVPASSPIHQALSAAFDSTPDPTALVDSAGLIVAVNEAWRRFARQNGASEKVIEGVGLDYLAGCSSGGPREGKSAAANVARLLAGEGSGFDVEYPCHFEDDQRYFELRGRRLLEGLFAFEHSDITRRRTAEDRLRISAAVANALEGSTDVAETALALIQSVRGVMGWEAGAFWELDPESGLIRCTCFYWPESICHAFETATWEWMCVIGEGHIGNVWTTKQPYFIPNVQTEPGFERASGAKRCGVRSSFGFPVISGSEVIGVIEISTREIRQPEYHLLESLAVVGAQVGQLVQRRRAEAQFEQMFDDAPDGLLRVDESGKIAAANRASERLFGLGREDLMGGELTALFPEAEHAAIDECATARKSTGVDFPVEISRSLGKGGHAGEWVLSVRDISARRSLEDQLAASRRLEAVGQLAAGVAHEINTPMQFIGDNAHFVGEALGDITRLLGDYQAVLSEARSGPLDPSRLDELDLAVEEADVEYLVEAMPKAIKSVSEGVTRVAEIVRAMKQFSHPGEKTRAPVDLVEALRTTCTVSRNEWKYVADLEEDFATDFPQVPCFIGPLNQVFLNLIVNAAHAITDVVGDGANGKGTIKISTRVEDGSAVIRIGDSGTGIPEHARSKLFDPFFTTKEVGKGTGQGLAIAYAVVVKKHGGQLSFETEMGVGTTFVIKLPLSVEEVEPLAAE